MFRTQQHLLTNSKLSPPVSLVVLFLLGLLDLCHRSAGCLNQGLAAFTKLQAGSMRLHGCPQSKVYRQLWSYSIGKLEW